MTLRNRLFTIFILLTTILYSCSEVPIPKPRGYPRIDLPQKSYVSVDGLSNLPLSFEYPSYGDLSFDRGVNEPGWFNIDFPQFKAKLYFTYFDINGNFDTLMESTYKLNVKNHIIKADAINEQMIYNPEERVYGILYNLKGNTATAVQFFATDSTSHFFRGSLYFNCVPNQDSLAPVIDFFREDVVHLIETLKWVE